LGASFALLGIVFTSLSLSAATWSPEVERRLAAMTVQEKVGQLLMVGFGGTSINRRITKWVRDRKVGGVVLFSRNISSLEQVAHFARGLHELSRDGTPIFLGLDQEGGNVVRLKEGAMLLPGNMALGASRSSTLAYVSGQALAIDLRRVGFNMNLAPVLDVNSNPGNPVIGVRSYGERADLVEELGSWYIRGQQELGVVAVAKHFPGHGDTRGDSHFSMPASDITIERLHDVELRPFKGAIDAGLDAIMTAHITLPRVAESGTLPATLSPMLLTGVLRHELGFEGIIVTDGLEMRGVVDRYGSGEAAVKAIIAGADMPMILWTESKKDEVYRDLLRAVRSGRISVERIDQSVRRILSLKERRGLFDFGLGNVDEVLASRNRNPVHERVAERIAAEAVTLVRNRGGMLPLSAKRYRKVVVLAPPGAFADYLERQAFIKVVRVPFIPSRSERDQAVRRLLRAGRDADAFVAAAVNSYHLRVIRQVTAARPRLPTALISLASPYYLTRLPDVDAYVCTYSYREVAQRAAARALVGEETPTGRLPITIPGLYAFGHRALQADDDALSLEGHR